MLQRLVQQTATTKAGVAPRRPRGISTTAALALTRFLLAYSVKSAGQNPQAAGLPQMNYTMVYLGTNAQQQQPSTSSATSISVANFLVSVAVAAAAAL